MFTDKDLIQIKAHGLTPQGVEKQMENFRRGFGFLPVDRAAVAGDGIRIFDKDADNMPVLAFDLERAAKYLEKIENLAHRCTHKGISAVGGAVISRL